MLPDACYLSHEVQVLHLQFFRRPAPQSLVEAYLKFHVDSLMLMQATDDELRTVVAVVNKGLDALGGDRAVASWWLSAASFIAQTLVDCLPRRMRCCVSGVQSGSEGSMA